MAGVTLKAVRKTYQGGVDAVKGVSFDVPDGAFCVLVGIATLPWYFKTMRSIRI